VGDFPADWFQALYGRPTPPRDAPPGLLRHLRDAALLEVYATARRCRHASSAWLTRQGFAGPRAYFQAEVDGRVAHWANLWHDLQLLTPVWIAALCLGWVPQGLRAEECAAIAGEYGGAVPWPEGDSPPEEATPPPDDDDPGDAFRPLFRYE
jgi:hypothetical protein